MTNCISHRGPDDFGVWTDDRCGLALGHRRLSILDLSPAGHQPMHSSCGRFVIAFNGEIYNHQQIRIQLEQEKVAPDWRGHSDTETLVTAFSAWGIERTLQAAVGMFAIAVWDRHEMVLTLARDRLGEKPLYWGWLGDTLIFGSELKTLKAHPAFEGQVDRNAVALLTRYNYIPSPHSVYQGIWKLQPGHYVDIRIGKKPKDAVPKPYWRMNDVIEQGLANPFTGTDSEAIDTLEEHLVQSISGQLLSDVPLGAFLSGGIDSSLVVALMQKHMPGSAKTFAIGFNETKYNEANYASDIARHLQTDHLELYVDAADALKIVPDMAQVYCEPFADNSQLPTFLLTRTARQHVTVALSGDGGDELFGGYNTYQFAPRLWQTISRLPYGLRKAASSAALSFPIPNRARKLADVLDAKDWCSFYHQLKSHWMPKHKLVLGASVPDTLFNTPSAWPQVENKAQWMMALEAQGYMIDDILVKVDRAAMSNSLETRIPILDHRVVEFAWRLPLSMKIRDGNGKWILRALLQRHVPKELFHRPKKGFDVPLGEWLRGPLRDWAEALIDRKRLEDESYFNADPIRHAWKQHLSGRADLSNRLWSVLMFQAWLERA